LIHHSHSVIPVLIGLLILASLIPVSNLLIPNIIAKKQVQTTAEILSAYGRDQKPGVNYLSGRILYPYYVGGSISFDFLHDQNLDSFVVPTKQIRNSGIWLKSGESAIIELNSENQIQRIYLFRDGELQIFWILK
jgi:hypothetical protein